MEAGQVEEICGTKNSMLPEAAPEGGMEAEQVEEICGT